jgi:hypothetical protein
VVDTAQKLGYHTVLGSVWPWDVYSKWPLLNALYISAKVYPGAVIVLHDRWVWQAMLLLLLLLCECCCCKPPPAALLTVSI